eukprot:1185735-Prorocentrum_minimum.AAC.2
MAKDVALAVVIYVECSFLGRYSENIPHLNCRRGRVALIVSAFHQAHIQPYNVLPLATFEASNFRCADAVVTCTHPDRQTAHE